ncbi:MAG: LptE family protein [Candidatus Omnitrophica bacterium]|nr:LptE family protein [Candidatus Omnitrophota bacterium]
MKHRSICGIVILSIFFSFSITLLSGCGYTTRSLISQEYKTIYVTPFVNKVDITQEFYAASKYRIYRPKLETDITTYVINRFLFDGNLKPSREETADMILKGELMDFRRDPLRYDDDDNVTEYRLNIVVNLTMIDKARGEVLWQENNFTGDTTYFTTGSLAKSEDAAIKDALNDLARRIVERTVEQW